MGSRRRLLPAGVFDPRVPDVYAVVSAACLVVLVGDMGAVVVLGLYGIFRLWVVRRWTW